MEGGVRPTGGTFAGRRGPRGGTSKRPSAVDVAFQLLDRVLLVFDDRFDEVAYRDDADDAILLDHGQVTDALLGDDAHALVDGIGGPDGRHRRAHDLRHRSLVRRTPEQDDFARVVALG